MLNLRNHEIACETKMSRIMLLLANRAFVVSHTLGDLSDPELCCRDGVVFVDTPDIAPTLLCVRACGRDNIAFPRVRCLCGLVPSAASCCRNARAWKSSFPLRVPHPHPTLRLV